MRTHQVHLFQAHSLRDRYLYSTLIELIISELNIVVKTDCLIKIVHVNVKGAIVQM